MKNFSQYLQDYIEKNNLSKNAMANLCQISRRTLGRYLDGSVYPNSMDKIKKIADILQLSETEKEEFYKIVSVESKKDDRIIIKELLNKILNDELLFKNKKEMANKLDINFEENTTVTLEGKEIIIQYLSMLLENTKKIQILITPNVMQILDTVLDKINTNNHITIDQIVRLHPMTEGKNVEQWEVFHSLLPLCFCEAKYVAYYYHGNIPVSNSQQENYIITDNGIIVFDNQMKIGIYSSQLEYLQYYQLKFSNLRNECWKFLASDNVELINTYDVKKSCEGLHSNISVLYDKNELKEKICIKTIEGRTRFLYIEQSEFVHILKSVM